MPEFSGDLQLRAALNHRGQTTLSAQSFRAPYHISKPYWDADSRTLLVQVVNPTAGILSGDRLASDITVESQAALLVTTPSASRVFKMRDGGSAECVQHFRVAAGGWLEVMPEPLVPHRGCTYRQRTHIEVESGGELFFTDQLASGRVAHGETWAWESLCLEVDVRLAGELVLRERFAHSGEDLRALAALAGSGASACFANAVLIADAQENDSAWQAAIHALHGDGVWTGVSRLRRGGWSLKFVASSSVHLRRTLRAARAALAVRFPQLQCDVRKL